jgi:hypothetical protein
MTSKSILLMGSKIFGCKLFKAVIRAHPDCNFSIIHPNDSLDERSVFAKFKKLEAPNVNLYWAKNKQQAEKSPV